MEVVLELAEPALQSGLTLVLLPRLLRREGRVIGEEGVHAVVLAVALDGLLVHVPREREVLPRDAAVLRVRPWATGAELLEGVVLRDMDPDAEIARHVQFRQDLLEPLVDLGPLSGA